MVFIVRFKVAYQLVWVLDRLRQSFDTLRQAELKGKGLETDMNCANSIPLHASIVAGIRLGISIRAMRFRKERLTDKVHRRGVR